MTDKALSLHLNVLVERQEDGSFLAHCLELDLVAEGSTSETAFSELLGLIDVQIRTCIDNDNLQNLFFPAPKEVWEKLLRARNETAHCRYERLERALPGRMSQFDRIEVDQFCFA